MGEEEGRGRFIAASGIGEDKKDSAEGGRGNGVVVEEVDGGGGEPPLVSCLPLVFFSAGLSLRFPLSSFSSPTSVVRRDSEEGEGDASCPAIRDGEVVGRRVEDGGCLGHVVTVARPSCDSSKGGPYSNVGLPSLSPSCAALVSWCTSNGEEERRTAEETREAEETDAQEDDSLVGSEAFCGFGWRCERARRVGAAAVDEAVEAAR